MQLLDRLSFGFSKPLPLILQTEASECGLACIGMVAAYYGYRTDLMNLRNRFPVSLKGATLADLIRVAGELNLNARPLKLDLEDLSKLRLPCVIHWNLNHFVVLKSVGSTKAVIYDPSEGIRTLPLSEVSESFTGVALEIWPGNHFKPQERRQPLKLRALMGYVTGIGASCAHILTLALALEVFALVSPFFLQWVVDDVLVSGDRNLLTTLGIGFGILLLMQEAVSAMRAWVIMYLSTTLNLQWRGNVFAHLLRLPVQYFEKRHLGDVVSRFNSIDLIQRTLTTSFIEAIVDGLLTVVTLVVMAMYSQMLSSIAIIAMLLYAISRIAWFAPLRSATEEQIVHAARQQSHFLESVRGVKTIKLFQRQDERRAMWLSLLVDQLNAELRTQKLQLLYKMLNGVFFGIENILIIWAGAALVLDGNFSVGALMSFHAYKGQFNSRFSSLIDKFFEVKMLQLQGERLADIVLSEPEASEAPLGLSTEHAPEPSIVLRNVRFRYSDHEPFTLDGIDLSVSPGESVAIVGQSGCGKTTLLNVMLGLLPPTEGEIVIGGTPLRQLGLAQIRAMVGTVCQDDVLFAGSIGDNISFFDPTPDRSWIAECAARAAIAADIATMPMGYNTLVGDMGTVLSGGQKQRLLLARALYKRPRILFLDEATSHLDIGREQEVNRAVKSLNMTRIIIAHRPETIASANRVVVIEGGKIVHDAHIPASQASPLSCNALA